MHTSNHTPNRQDPNEPLAGRSVFEPAPQPEAPGPRYEPTTTVPVTPAPPRVPGAPAGPIPSAKANSKQRAFIAGAALTICGLLGAGVGVALAGGGSGGSSDQGEPGNYEFGDPVRPAPSAASRRDNVSDPGDEPGDDIYPVTGPNNGDTSKVPGGEPPEDPGDQLYPVTGPGAQDPGDEPGKEAEDAPDGSDDPGPQVIDPSIVLILLPDPDPGPLLIPVPTTTTPVDLYVDF